MTLQWYSILVSTFNPENGPKNPLKGISMKSLVNAFDAQLRVLQGVKVVGAFYNGMKIVTLPPWRPEFFRENLRICDWFIMKQL